METPLVSVVVPNYNHAKYLEKRLDTVFNQTYCSFEVIILDDCSVDNSLQIINKYSSNPHLSAVIVNESNSGSTFWQWEKGIQLANGDLIWIAESDDYNELSFLEEMVNSFLSNSALVLCFSNYIWFNDNGIIKQPRRSSNRYFDGHRFIRGWMAIENAVSNASGVVFKRQAYEHISKDYLSFKAAGDYQFWVEIASQGDIGHIRNVMTFFRKNTDSVTSNNMKNGNSVLEDIRVNSYILEHNELSFFQRQAMCARFSAKYRNLSFNLDIINKMNSFWHSNKRHFLIDHYYLRSIRFVRDYFGLLCI